MENRPIGFYSHSAEAAPIEPGVIAGLLLFLLSDRQLFPSTSAFRLHAECKSTRFKSRESLSSARIPTSEPRDPSNVFGVKRKKIGFSIKPVPAGASSSTFLRSSIMRAKDSNPIFYFATRLIRASSGRGKKRGRKLQPTHCPSLLRVSELLW